jgi:hypothetical protein
MPLPLPLAASTNTPTAEPGPSSGNATHHPSWNSSIFTPHSSISSSSNHRISGLGSQPGGSNGIGSTTSLNRPPPYERRRSVSFMNEHEARVIEERPMPNFSGLSEREEEAEKTEEEEDDGDEADTRAREERNHGMLSRMMALYAEEAQDKGKSPMQDIKSKINDVPNLTNGTYMGLRKRSYSIASRTSIGSQLIDEDDPRITGKRKKHLDDIEDLENLTMRHMNYKNRRKERNRMKVMFNVTCEPCTVSFFFFSDTSYYH